jgi:hypothetical protein
MDGEEGLTVEDKRESELLVEALSCVLTHLSSLVSSPPDAAPSRFHSTRAPSISLKDYLLRMNRYFQCSPSCFVLALVYIDRALKQRPAQFLVDSLSVHRVVLSALVVAAKFFDDCYYSNAFYAKVGGVKVSELNALEVAFLAELLHWNLHVTASDFAHYRNHVLLAVAPPPPPSFDDHFGPARLRAPSAVDAEGD